MQLSGAIAGGWFALSLALRMGTAIRSAPIAHTCRFAVGFAGRCYKRPLALVLIWAALKARNAHLFFSSYVAPFRVLDHTYTIGWPLEDPLQTDTLESPSECECLPASGSAAAATTRPRVLCPMGSVVH